MLSLRPRTILASLGLCALGLVLLPSPRASGYAIEVHKDFFDLAFGGRDAGRRVTPPSAAGLESFRRFFYEHASRDPEVRRRWPTAAAFDAAAFKELLALNPNKRVVGIDHVPADRPQDLRTVVREGSVDPDNDLRNQDRLFVEGGRVVLDPFGRAVPYDPRTVWFGGLTGTPSQFDAHGATLRTGEKGGGLWTALTKPEQFARPPVALGSAPEFSQVYTDLAMVARLWGGEGWEWLALTFGGNNLHGIEDLGNQIHTTVLGIPQFFLDAKMAYYGFRLKRLFKKRADAAEEGFTRPDALTPDEVNEAMRLVSAGKADQADKRIRFALGQEPQPAPDDFQLGVRIIGNHHRLLEDFIEKQFLKGHASIRAGRPEEALPEVRELVRRAQQGDAAFERACRAALRKAGLGQRAKGQTPYGRVLAEVMIEHSAPEAAPIYKAIRAISKPELKSDGIYDGAFGHDPLDWVTARRPAESEHVRAIWELAGRAFARVVTALRLWEECYQQETRDLRPGSPEAHARAQAIAQGLAARQVRYLAEAKARRDQYLAEKQKEWQEQEAERNKPGLLERVKAFFGGGH